MTSGEWITWYLFGGLTFLLTTFMIWELVQLYRRRQGNKSALTLTQYVTNRAEGGSKGWLITIIAFPIFLIVVGLWLSFHFEGWCTWQGWFCELSKKV